MSVENKHPPTLSLGFLVGVEIDPTKVSTEDIMNKIGDSLNWVDGIVFHDVEFLGEIDQVEDDEIFKPEGNA